MRSALATKKSASKTQAATADLTLPNTTTPSSDANTKGPAAASLKTTKAKKNKGKVSDRDAKDKLLEWPTIASKLWTVPSAAKAKWIQAQPKAKGSRAKHPTINTPGAKLFATQPDGMWTFTDGGGFADVICVEVCGTIQNLNDKRSRYAPFGPGLVVTFPVAWWKAEIARPGKAGYTEPRWKAAGAFSACPSADTSATVRHLRVLYAIPDAQYDKWQKNNVPAAYEYVIKHSSLSSHNSPDFRTFLRGMSPSAHWYP